MSNFYRDRIRNGVGRIGVVLVSFLFVLPVFAKSTGASPEELARMIYRGNFAQAGKVLSTQPAGIVTRPTDPLGMQLQKYDLLSNQREKVRAETYSANVKESREYLEKSKKVSTSQNATTKPASRPGSAATKGNIEKALTGARRAKYYAVDPKKFGQLDWVREIAQKAKSQAGEYLKKHEWLKAGNIYAELATIYEDDKGYDKSTRDCAMRVRLEATYKSKTEWNEQIKDIKIAVIPELSYSLANGYVEKPEFGKMIVMGLQSVAMLTETPKLMQVFPSLNDKTKTALFDSKIKSLINEVNKEKAKKTLSTREFYQAFIKLLVDNDDTINLPQEVIIKEFVDSALGELDPFTNVIWPAELDDFDKHTTGRFSGVGIQLSMENNKLKVITPVPGSPAYHAGILPGDLIVSIDGESTEGITIDKAVRKITGPKGTRVVLGITHPWAEHSRETPMIRDTIIIQTVKGYRMDKDNEWQFLMDPPNDTIGYIRITSFTDTTVDELSRALRRLRQQGVKGLIIDLRFNPGGTLKAAVETVNLFITRGVVVTTKGRNTEPMELIAAAGSGQYADIPLIILINNFSASAAEIVSGALKDYHRAWLIGERSFGKGSVQNVLPLVDESSKLKITTAYYYLPKGRCLHRKPDSKDWGVDPDLKIDLTPNELRDIIDIQRDAEIVTQVNGMKVSSLATTTSSARVRASTATSSESEDEVEKPPVRKYPPEDIQLQAAVAVMQARFLLKLPWETIPTTTNSASEKIVVQTGK
ncbi:MAG: S41 family peptidase [Phycisphaerae bacterium]